MKPRNDHQNHLDAPSDSCASRGGSHRIIHRFRFHSNPSALAAASELNGLGLRNVCIEPEPARGLQMLFGPRTWRGVAEGSAVPGEALVSSMIQIASIYGGNYEGWEAGAPGDTSISADECELPLMG